MNKVSFLALGVVIIYSSCTSGNATTASNNSEKTYPVVQVLTKDTFLQQQYVADIQARKNVELHARVPGLLDKIFVQEGQSVRQGQLLFKINDAALRIELSKATAAFRSAQAEAKVADLEADRIALLVDKKVISDTEFKLAEARHQALLAKVEMAKAEMDAVNKQIAYTAIHAPFDGIIDRIPLKEGSLLAHGSLLTTLSDLTSVYAYFNLSEQEYFQWIQSGDQGGDPDIQLILPDGSVYAYSGKLAAAESEIDEATGSIAFKVHFPNPQLLLKHGASGKLLLSRPVLNAMLIPQKSVFEIQDKNFVYVLQENQTVKMQMIHPTQRIADYYIVTSGLKGKEHIVYEGIQSIRDGEKIKPETRQF